MTVAESFAPFSHTLSLLLRHTDGPTATTGGLGVLTTYTETPVVSETPVGPDLLQALEILTELAVHTVGENLVVTAIDDIALSVEEPGRNLEVAGVLDDGDLFLSVQVDQSSDRGENIRFARVLRSSSHRRAC